MGNNARFLIVIVILAAFAVVQFYIDKRIIELIKTQNVIISTHSEMISTLVDFRASQLEVTKAIIKRVQPPYPEMRDGE